jgi:translation elongation factor EF-1beta
MAGETCLMPTSSEINVRKIEKWLKKTNERDLNTVGEEECHFGRRLRGFALSSF